MQLLNKRSLVSVFFMINFSITQKQLNLHKIRPKLNDFNKNRIFFVIFCRFRVELTL
jgi:hypothetical protein